MKLCNRQRLGFLAELGWTMRRIAEDMGWSAQTISDELHNRRVDSDMPFAGRSREPHKKPETKTTARCRVGRTIREMWEWLKHHAGVVPCELDTVIGSISRSTSGRLTGLS